MDLMSAAQLLGNLGEFLGSVVVIGTLIYLAIQINTAKSEIDANSFNTTNSNAISVETAFLANAEIWSKAITGCELTPSETFTFDTLTDMRAQHAFFGYRRSQALGNGRELIHAINLALWFQQYPTAYERWLAGAKKRRSLREAAGWAPRADFETVVENALAAMNAGVSRSAIPIADA